MTLDTDLQTSLGPATPEPEDVFHQPDHSFRYTGVFTSETCTESTFFFTERVRRFPDV